MDAIINELSLDAQFEKDDDFFDSLERHTLRIINSLAEGGVEILKSSAILTRQVTLAKTVTDFYKMRGSSEVTRMLSLLTQVTGDPFWDAEPMSEAGAKYHCDHTGYFDGSTPNQFSEAYERSGVLISFCHSAFKRTNITVSKNGAPKELTNLHNHYSTLLLLLKEEKITLLHAYEALGKPYDVIFLKKQPQSKELFADEYETAFSTEEKLSLMGDFLEFVEGKKAQTMKDGLVKSIPHKNVRIFEFRTSTNTGRQFRIYFYKDNKVWCCLNSLNKTTQKPPDHVKDYSVKLVGIYKDRKRKNLLS